MSEAEQLILASRHFCLDRIELLNQKRRVIEDEVHKPQYNSTEYQFFLPRISAIRAILLEVETLLGQNFSSFDSCKNELVERGRSCNNIRTDPNGGFQMLAESGMFYSRIGGRENHRPILEEERIEYLEFIQSRTIENTSGLLPLPFTHKLTELELISIRRYLSDNWNIFDHSYWDFKSDMCRIETVFVMLNEITSQDEERIVEFLKSISKNRICVLEEERTSYEIEFDSFKFWHIYMTTVVEKEFEWVIHGSYEVQVTFGGTALVAFINMLFADRPDKLNKYEMY